MDSVCHVDEDVAVTRCEEGPILIDHGEIAKVESTLMNMAGVPPNLSGYDKAIQMVIEDIGNDELISFLREDISLVELAKDWAGDGLLAIAAWHDKPDIVRILLREFKVDVNSKNYSKATPLHRASSSGSMRCATILLEKGANAEACDVAGRTPVDVGVTESIRQLIKDRIRADKEVIRQLHVSIARADEEFEDRNIQMLLADHTRKIARRLNQAVPIVISGAFNEDANGTYDPIYELHDDWPIYRRRDCKIRKIEIILQYESVKSAWSIKCIPLDDSQGEDSSTLFDSPGSPGRRGKWLVFLYSDVASFPELRLEGSNRIKESGARSADSKISVTPESEMIGAMELAKLKRSNFPIPIKYF